MFLNTERNMANKFNEDDVGFIEENETDEVDSEPVGNPAPPPDVDLDLLRGDRIGDTVYSGKWCIQTVMKLLQSNVVAKSSEGEDKRELVDMEEDLQNEVGVLWDMTINVEVCQYLQSVGAIESIYHVIGNSKCPRATEMCVGMLANIASHEELWQSLNTDETLFDVLIPLLSHSDQPLLLELTRFFNTALNHQENCVCYDSLWENRQLVSQELLRILSGSTHGDLLRQTSDFTHMLMSLDQDDTRFNTLFADVDFITAVLEASKEFGYKQESAGQVRVMDILHCFTTFELGITAMEPCMEGMTRAGVKYFKMLCHSLNLSSSCDVIIVIIRILNHIFCRSLAVRIELMSSPRLAHCMLKTLVSAYRRLGMYNSIAIAPSSKTTKEEDMKASTDQLSSKLAAVPSPSWENLPSEGGRKSGRPEEASWSERAGAGEATGQSYRTPDASPLHAHKPKEMELSWSERRIASPLTKITSVTDNEKDWKRPAERKKKLKKKKESQDRSVDDEKQDRDGAEGSMNSEKFEDEEKRDAMEESNTGEEDDDTKDSSASERLAAGSSLPASQSQDEPVCSIVSDRRACRTDSNVSEGFEPSQHETDNVNDIPERMELDDKVIEHDRGEDKRDTGEKKTCQSGGNDSSSIKDSDGRSVDDCGENSDSLSQRDRGPGSGKFMPNHSEKSESGLFNHDDEESKDFSSANGDKYQTLLNVLNEFLTDFFNNIRESLTTEGGESVLSETVAYLNTQCSSTSIRALTRCITSNGEVSKPLSRLLDLATQLKAFHLRHVILEYIPDAKREEIQQ